MRPYISTDNSEALRWMPKAPMDLIRCALFVVCALAPCMASYDGWGPWSSYSECSRSCGGGVQHTSRTCLRDSESQQKECQGSATQYRSCNVQPCLDNKDFRHQQCEAYNGVPLFDPSIHNSTWEPYNDISKPCKLICRAQNGETRTLKDVIDGTSCDTARDLGICVHGICRPVGCDRVLGSSKPEDKCLVCDGEGRDCETVASSTRRQQLSANIVNDVVVFPPEARSIRIKVEPFSNTVLELRNGRGNVFRLNDLEKTFSTRQMAEVGGVLFTYENDGDSVTYLARGPLAEPLQLKVWFQDETPVVDYEYSTPSEQAKPQHDEAVRYVWKHGRWSRCSKECGDGIRRRPVGCVDTKTGRVVLGDYCGRRDKPSWQQSCNVKPCETSKGVRYGWTQSTWGDCDVACGAGKQKRNMLCQETDTAGLSRYVAMELCLRNVGQMPLYERSCFGDDCPYWAAGNWGDCSVTCGTGMQRRRMYCQRDPPDETASPILVSHDQCPSDKRPADVQACRRSACPERPREVTRRPDCERYRYGCCPDGRTPARGLRYLGCPRPDTENWDFMKSYCSRLESIGSVQRFGAFGGTLIHRGSVLLQNT
ncbi:hypothetical protein RRG08_048796 [Elysia crispata]|uniref:Uncharacterized protein n=1 Tax=Elysia crispata TaxID=231223 RepID=A0AAE1AMS1_9GAST|nr:hypothetical protein RRG08_048796 [Elysia crispata]